MNSTRNRLIKIINRLKKAYKGPRASLRDANPFQLLIATILSAQCTDDRASRVASYLFKKYKNIKNFAKAKRHILEKELYSTGFYRHKAKNIIGASKKIIEDYKGRVPNGMEKLIALPGVGRKTANIVLSGAFKKAEGIAVDTHVKRLSIRLRLSNQYNPDKIEKDLLGIVPKKNWLDFNYIFVNHGRKVCRARSPLCSICLINDLCPSAWSNI